MRKNPVPLLGLLLALLLGVGFYFLLYSPKHDELVLVREQTAVLETRSASLRNEIAALREVEANQVQIRASLARLEEYIPSGPAQSFAVRQFQLAADAAGVEIVSVTFAVPEVVLDAPPTGTPGTSLARIPVTMTVDGGYFQIVDFLRRIEVETTRAVYVGNLEAIEAEDGFPALSSTWIGEMFTVVPTPASLAPVPPPPTPEDADAPADADADADAAVEDVAQEATS